MKLASFKKGHRAFTLIELLVVIAIIGILSSVVLASLNTARSKGTDASIKSNLSQARAEAELHYDSNSNSYAAVCDSTNAINIFDAATAAATALGGGAAASRDAVGSATVVACNDTATEWAMQSALKSPTTTTYYCVDHTGATRESTTNMLTTTADTDC